MINGLTDLLHPCQAMADLQTIAEQMDPRKATVAWVGDGNNMAVSWIHAAARFGRVQRLRMRRRLLLSGTPIQNASPVVTPPL